MPWRRLATRSGQKIRYFTQGNISNAAQVRFGEKSQVSTTILETLRKFACANISKRETLSVISNAISGHPDLKHDMMEILNHKDSRWSPGDFDTLDIMPHQRAFAAVPQTLQPVQQSQMRLPSIATLWGLTDQTTPIETTSTQQGLDERDKQPVHNQDASSPPRENVQWHLNPRMIPTSPSLPSLTNERLLKDFQSHDVEQTSKLPSLPSSDHRVAPSTFTHEAGRLLYLHQPLAAPHRGHDSILWNNSALDHFDENDKIFTDDQLHSQVVSHDDHTRRGTMLNKLQREPMMFFPTGFDAATLGTPASLHRSIAPAAPKQSFAIQMNQPATDTPAPPRKRSRKSCTDKVKVEEQHDLDDEADGVKTLPGKQRPHSECRSQASRNEPKIPRRALEVQFFPYIHNLCGKGFATRNSVKKHHWGKKIDDLSTSTGCWAKNGKPNSSWDDHPSCKTDKQLFGIEQARSGTVSTAASRTPAPVEYRAPVVPAMIPSYNNHLPGFPTLQHLPQAVADALNPMPTTAQWGLGMHRPLEQQAPPSSPLNKLLTAVNFASKFESNGSKGRNDSVVTQNDLHIAAVGSLSQDPSSWNNPTRRLGTNFHHHHLPETKQPWAVPHPVTLDSGYVDEYGDHIPKKWL